MPATQLDSSGKVSPDLLAMMVDLLPEIGSLRDLCAITGVCLDVVRRETAPFRAIMKLQGTHPKCECGRDRFHPYGCSGGYAKAARNPVPGCRREHRADVLAKRALIIDMLVAGDRFVDIDRSMGFSGKAARGYLRYLTPDQLAKRDHAVRQRTRQLEGV